ncbi:MAG: hypothetical protein GY801_43405, partial [bacterium]|nr:hypothetical protein [bacterium]
MRKVLVTIVACMLMTGVFVGVSHATLIDLDDVDGKGYFKDSETQMIWMDLDNFFGMTYGEAHAMLDGTGFSLATHAQMATLEAYIGASDLLVGGSDQLMLGSSP